MVNKMCTDIVNKHDSIIAETVKKEITVATEPFESKVGSLIETVADLERSANSHSSQLMARAFVQYLSIFLSVCI